MSKNTLSGSKGRQRRPSETRGKPAVTERPEEAGRGISRSDISESRWVNESSQRGENIPKRLNWKGRGGGGTDTVTAAADGVTRPQALYTSQWPTVE